MVLKPRQPDAGKDPGHDGALERMLPVPFADSTERYTLLSSNEMRLKRSRCCERGQYVVLRGKGSRLGAHGNCGARLDQSLDCPVCLSFHPSPHRHNKEL